MALYESVDYYYYYYSQRWANTIFTHRQQVYINTQQYVPTYTYVMFIDTAHTVCEHDL